MLKLTRTKLVAATLALALGHIFPSFLWADDLIEKGGVAIGVSVGNYVFLPAKFASVTIGLLAGATSWVLTGGNTDLTKQIWRDTTEGPYLITPELAKKGVGERPLLTEQKQAAESPAAAQ